MSPQTNDLYTALQWHFPWHKARVKFVASFIIALLQVTTVNLVRLANGLNGQADKKSNYRRIQRFFALFEIDPEDVEDTAPWTAKWTLGGQSDIFGNS